MASPSELSRKELRAKYQPWFDELFKAYPLHQGYAEGFSTLLDMLADGSIGNLDLVLEKARSFARNTDPQKLQYVPLIRSWLRGKRYEDEDLFTDQVVAQREWLVGAWKRGDTRAVSDKYGFIYTHPPVPEGVEDREAWHLDQRKAWVAAIALHILKGEPLP